MSKRIGYPRVSTNTKGKKKDNGESNGNTLEAQEEKLRAAGADIIMPEQFTGTKMDRPVLNQVLEMLEEGDTLMVTKLDRLARTAGEGSILVKELLARGVKVHILNMGMIEDTTNGRMILNILLAFAEFERDMIVERLNEGKEVAKANNPSYKEGRKTKEKPAEYSEVVVAVDAGILAVKDACEKLGISRSLWYKWQREAEVMV
jgi:DNA invertase Pin-like site-specific DNA recombinase